MVEASLCRMRLQEYRDIGGGILEELPSHVKAAQPQLLRLHITGTPADIIGFSEISAPTSVMDEAAAVVMEHKSTSNEDHSGGGPPIDGAVATINTIGIDENDKIINRTETQHATTGTTVVTTTNLYKTTFHIHAISWGSAGKDATGQIDFRDIATDVKVSILATKNESNGSSFKVPDGHVAMLFGGRLTRLAETVDEGNSIRILYTDVIDAIGVDSLLSNWLEFVVNGAIEQYTVIPKGHMFKSGTWIQFQHSSLVNLGEPYDLTLDFLIWKK